MKKRLFAYAKTKTQISCAVTAQLICAFVIATWIVQSNTYLNRPVAKQRMSVREGIVTLLKFVYNI